MLIAGSEGGVICRRGQASGCAEAAQVAALYPVTVFHDQAQHAENPPPDANGENPLLILLS